MPSNLKTDASGKVLRGPGRPPGAANKVTKSLKEMILGALQAKGGQAWLEEQMEINPGPFMQLIGKMIPAEVKTELTGKDGTPLFSPEQLIRMADEVRRNK